MASAEESFRQGDLAACLTSLQADVRRRPEDVRQRVFLVQVLMVLGEWERALTQLGVLKELDTSALPMVHSYGAAIQCERLRAAVFRGERSPLLFGEPEPWIAQMIQAVGLQAQGHGSEAAALRIGALEAAPAMPGTLNDTPFEWLADADPRLGPLLEVLLNGNYYWVPMHRVHEIRVEAPADIRDLVWLPAEFVWANGGEAVGFIPTRYPGSESSTDDAIRLARRTEWIGPEGAIGLGQRLLATDAAEVGLLELRSVTFERSSA
ncbi:MAG: type VI secretion system accessory protein TagJ [Steroidobacteraceae bacterium]